MLLPIGVKENTSLAHSMIEYLIAISLILLCIGHAMLVKGCLTWTKERRVGMTSLEDRLGTLATLIDEGLDMLGDFTGDGPSASPASHQPFDLKELLSAALMSKLMPDPEHGSTQGQKGPIQEEDDTQTEETEV